MKGQFEMLYDALYISLLGISSSAPWQLNELTWANMIGNSNKDSIPPLEDFTINWRPNAKRVIIVFSDEHGQSYMVPKSVIGGSWDANVDGVTQKILLSNYRIGMRDFILNTHIIYILSFSLFILFIRQHFPGSRDAFGKSL